MKYLHHTSENSWNICNIRLKHLQNTRKKLENMCVAIANMSKHQDETLAAYIWKHLKHLHIYGKSRSSFAPSKWHICNTRLKQMKHSEHTLETYVYSHCNMCNISIYFCNILMKHLQHTSKTSETFEMYTCNMHHIPVRSPLPSASGHQSHSRRWGQRASTPGPDASPCVGGACRYRWAGWAMK